MYDHRYLVRAASVVFLLFFTSACSGALQPGPAGSQGDSSSSQGGPNGSIKADDGRGGSSGTITTEGTEFDGTIEAETRFRVGLEAQEGDRIVARLERANETEWEPSLKLIRLGENSEVVAGNDPEGMEDAYIPKQQGKRTTGWEFWHGGQYQLVLENKSVSAGEFRFTLECRGGPCQSGSASEGGRDRDGDGIPDREDNCPDLPNEQQLDEDGDGLGAACDPAEGGVNPYAEFEDSELEEKLRTDHTVHDALSYKEARQHMFVDIDNEDGVVEGVYTGDTIRTEEIPDPSEFNCEHSWPKSDGAEAEPPKSDIHHLFPTNSKANSRRGSYPFGIVEKSEEWSKGGSKFGLDADGDRVFEVRPEYRGDIARAHFYFAVVYDQAIEREEEELLRRWHEEDPVDRTEIQRNRKIEQVQESRNRFVDYPELVDRISNF